MIAALSLAIGTIIGELIDIDRHLNKFGDFLQKKLSRNTENSSFGEGFVNATLFTCVGAMAIVGAIEAGMQGSFSTYYAKLCSTAFCDDNDYHIRNRLFLLRNYSFCL